MTRLTFPSYLDHLRINSARFREVLTDCDPAARVPACPDWDADDLLWHLAEVQWFWTQVVSTRPAPPPEDDYPRPDRPSDHADLVRLFDEVSAGLAETLAHADPDAEAWTWADEQTVGFTYRRQAHESLIHRLDAEQTAGTVTDLDPALAADGVAELVEVMYGGEPPAWGRFEAGEGAVDVVLADAGRTIRVRPGMFYGTDPDSGHNYDGPHLVVVPEPSGAAAATLSGTAADLDAWLWKRRDDTGIGWSGEPGPRERFMAAVDAPLT